MNNEYTIGESFHEPLRTYTLAIPGFIKRGCSRMDATNIYVNTYIMNKDPLTQYLIYCFSSISMLRFKPAWKIVTAVYCSTVAHTEVNRTGFEFLFVQIE